MNAKWLIFILITSLTLLGVNQSQDFNPNQEIVLKFNKEVTPSETQEAIAILKGQLQSLGVHNIKLYEESKEKLKIVYYSDLDVSIIKLKLSDYYQVLIDYTAKGNNPLPEKSPNTKDYNLDIFEIKEGGDVDLASKGYMPNTKTEKDRSFTPKLYVFFNNINPKYKQDFPEKLAGYYGDFILLPKTTPHKTPRVRAGPLA